MSNARNLALLLKNNVIIADAIPEGIGGGGVTAYDSASLLPISATIGDQSFTSNDNTIYIWNGSQWLDTNRQVIKNFYLIQAGIFTSPLVSNLTYTPTATIQLINLYSTINAAVEEDIIFSVMKNSTTLQTFTIPAGLDIIETSFTNNEIISSDILNINILSGSGKDLVVKVDYKEL